MAVASMGVVTGPEQRNRRHSAEHARSRKLMRLAMEQASALPVPIAAGNAAGSPTSTDAMARCHVDYDLDAVMVPTGRGALEQLSSESMQHMMSFLPVTDRFALLSTHRRLLADEPLATQFTSFCGRCESCTDKLEHLCPHGQNESAASFWTCLLRHAGSSGLRELRVAVGSTFTASLLEQLGPDQCIQALGNLRVLDLNRALSLDAHGLDRIAETCTSLHEVHFRDMPLDAAAFTKLMTRNRDKLSVVDLQGCHTVTGQHVRAISICANLSDLSLWGCHNVDNDAIASVVRATGAQLTRLNLRYCHKVNDALVLTIVTHAPLLRELNLRYCFKVTDVGVAALCDAGENRSKSCLETLNLSQCAKITDASIARIVASLKSLRELRLWGCAKLTSAAVRAISVGLPALTLVDIRSRDKLEAVIGGDIALRMLVHTYRDTLDQWQPADEAGVFKRMPACLVAA